MRINLPRIPLPDRLVDLQDVDEEGVGEVEETEWNEERGVRGEVRLREGVIEGGVMGNGEVGGGVLLDRRVVK